MSKESQNMLHLGFHINVANININNTEELSESGKNILKLAKKGDDITFKECVSLLEKNLSVLYLSFNVYELEDVFDSSFEDEIDALEFKVVKVYKSKGDYINFDLEGSFKIAVTQEIKTEERLREIEEEFDGHFDNGVTVQVDIFNENDGDELVNDGMGDGIDGHEGLSIWVIE